MREFHITQAGPKSPPITDVSLTCGYPGCWTRLVLPRDVQLADLDAWAAYRGWHRGAFGNDRCPQHRPGAASLARAAALSPVDTQVDATAVLAAAATTPITGYPHRPAVQAPRSHDGTYLPPAIDTPKDGNR